jgi:mannose-6-phosphate isomerase-like protein (cupin superfamily)
MKGLIRIAKGKDIYAIVLRREYTNSGPNFFTPGEFSQQLGMLIHPKGKIVNRHRHKLVKREIFRTQEVLVLLAGKIRVELFDDEGGKLKTVILKPGDAILLAQGGHKVKVLEDAKIIEVKQGPYAGFDDKEFF